MATEKWERLTPEGPKEFLMFRRAVSVDGLTIREGFEDEGELRSLPYGQEIVMDMDEIAALPPVHNLIDGLTGHEDKSLWWLSYVSTIVNEYEREHDMESDEDPSATIEAIHRVRNGIAILFGCLADLGVM